MGCYDELGDVQVKVGDSALRRWEVGQKVDDDIPDGIYVGYEGIAVVANGVFVGQFDKITDKWGYPIEFEDLLTSRNPMWHAAKRILKGRGIDVDAGKAKDSS